MKKIFLVLAGLSILLGAHAQNPNTAAGSLTTYVSKDSIQGWRHTGLTNLTFGQTSLQNWVAGGNNTVSGDFIFNASLNYLKNKVFWDNNLALEYGTVFATSSDWTKAADKLNLTSIAGRKISKTWSLSALLNFNTQFTKGYDYTTDRNKPISNFMAPGYLDIALGFSYKPNAKYSLFLSPISERATFVLDDSLSNQGAFGVTPGKRTLFETGIYILGSTTQKISNNMNVISSLDLFTPYSKDFGHIDVNWDLLINYKLNKLLSATLNTTLRYYEKEIEKIQFKEILGFGFTYNF